MIQYLHLDCEMGGRELKYSLLTSYFMVTDDKFNVLGELYLETKPDDGDYIVSGQGMSVNCINLQTHDGVAIPYKVAKPQLFNFLKKMSNGSHLTPVGHGVKGDINHVIDKLISRGSWEQFCTYHYIDTSVVLQFLRACGKMPQDTDGSVAALAKYFGIEPSAIGEYPNYHDARFDTRMTAAIYRKMVELVTR
jgi:hypothetical protein